MTSSLQKFFLVFINFIIFNAGSYNKSSSCIDFAIRLHYLIQSVLRNTEVVFVDKMCFKNK